ncbi:unnamed protein product [Arabis nemorensis]|uniref:Cytochrome P450 n=1 Tax=Arabis nemorensis TaxID=586526 RepID=A0A565BBE5_9BRAS|nr:unnamed protein product [Arabis nemorensis]
MASDIFKAHDVNISNRGFALIDESLFLGSYSFLNAPYGDYWKFIVQKLFRAQAVELARVVCAEELERFYANLLYKAKKKESVEIHNETLKLFINITCRISMGRRCSEENGEAERLRDLIKKCSALTKKLFFADMSRRKLGISLFKKEIMEVSHECDEFLERLLVEHEKKLKEDQDKDMIDFLLDVYRDKTARVI